NNGYIGLQVRTTSSTSSAKNNQFVGNTISGNSQWGVFIDSSSYNTYSYNNISTTTSNDGIITYQQFANSPDYNTFSGNNVFSNHGYGINIVAGSGNSITNNYIYNNVKGSINNSGSGTSISGNSGSAPNSLLPSGPVSTACAAYPTDKGAATVSI